MTSTPSSPTSAPQPRRSLLGIGGPIFNAMLVTTLMAISFAAVALPERTDETTTSTAALPFEEPTDIEDSSATAATDTTTPTDSDSTTTPPPAATTETAPPEEAEGSPVLEEGSVVEVEEVNLLGGIADTTVDNTPRVQSPAAPTPTIQEVERVVYRTERVVVEVPAETIPRRHECSDFATRPDAQIAFDADPETLAHFDGDGDGLACEQLIDPTPPTPAQTLCTDFPEWTAAQATFLNDPDGLSHLDGDGDGRACEQLPGTPPDEPEPAPAAAVLSATEVLQQNGVFGLHTREAPWWMGEVDYLSRLIGKAPNNLLFFSNWATPFPAEQVQNAWDRSMTPQVAWEPVIPGADRQPTLREIADGDWDAYIDDWAAAAAAHGQPIVLRLAAEMNGNWYSWSEGVNGNEAGDFADMWRHVRGRFDAAGADNVVWLWSVNRSDNLRTEIADYWPGEDYVDWVGIAGYWRGFSGAPEPTFSAIFDRTLGELRSLTDKPILLAEVGAGTDVDTDRARWLTTLFDGLEANPDIIGFVYFNDVKSGGDWRIQFSQTLVDIFANGVANERFPTGLLPTGMELGDRLNVPAHNDPDNTGLADVVTDNRVEATIREEAEVDG